MTTLSYARCREIADGNPDIASGEFRSAVATIRARMSRAAHPDTIEFLESLQNDLLAHGDPQDRRRPSPEELSAIRREASWRGLRARAKAALARRMVPVAPRKAKMVCVTDKTPAVFDAALEMIEDGDAVCVHHAIDGKIGAKYRLVTVVASDQEIPDYHAATDCPWQSARRQNAERI